MRTNLKTTQGKTDVNLVLPCTDHLKATLDAHKAALAYVPLASKAILSLDNGNRMTYFYMAKVMRAERIRLGLEAYDLHALRYRGVMELAWAGCTDDEIASFSGHATMAMIKKYAGEARQIMLEIKGEAARRLGIKKLDKTFQDLRDTAFTEMKEAGFDKHQIASRTQQSPASIDRLDQKHYGITTTAISDDAADLLDRARSRKSSAHMRDKTA